MNQSKFPDFMVINGGKADYLRETLHYAWMALLSAYNALDLALEVEEGADDQLQQAKLFQQKTADALSRRIRALSTTPVQDAGATQAIRELVARKKRALESSKHYQQLYDTALESRVNAQQALNSELDRFEDIVLRLAGISARWHENALVVITDDFGSVAIGYGSFTGDPSQPALSDYDGRCTLSHDGELAWLSKPKGQPPR